MNNAKIDTRTSLVVLPPVMVRDGNCSSSSPLLFSECLDTLLYKKVREKHFPAGRPGHIDWNLAVYGQRTIGDSLKSVAASVSLLLCRLVNLKGCQSPQSLRRFSNGDCGWLGSKISSECSRIYRPWACWCSCFMLRISKTSFHHLPVMYCWFAEEHS